MSAFADGLEKRLERRGYATIYLDDADREILALVRAAEKLPKVDNGYCAQCGPGYHAVDGTHKDGCVLAALDALNEKARTP